MNVTSNVLLAYQAMINKGGLVVTIQGSSMNPTYQQDECVHIVPANEIEINDIIAYIYKERLILHRVVEKYKAFLVTKGDGVSFADPPIKVTDILGKVDIPRGLNSISNIYARDNININFICPPSQRMLTYMKLFKIKHSVQMEPQKNADVCHIAIVPNSENVIDDLLQDITTNYYTIHFCYKIENNSPNCFYKAGEFDQTARIGSYIMPYILNEEEMLIYLLTELTCLK